ncbi:hypothetical protein LR004_00185 [Candidatus Gracilibacteria bacterium]|nr:hypothetical protein [Candidatus Gracilibacteria bacterium]
MKIFSNFDTKLDVRSFKKKIKQYGDGNVLLVKRHPLFLYKAFLNAVLALLLFGIYASILYTQYSDNLIYFYIFLFLHLFGITIWLVVLFRKIVSHLWNYVEFVRCKADLDKIDLGQFGFFLKFSFVLFIYQIIISLVDLIGIYFTRSEGISNFGLGASLIILNLLFLFLIIKIIYRFIDFEMDFMIVTKDEIESFDQAGIFRRKIVSMDLEKFRSITTEKKGFIRSVFNFGSLIVLSEGDSNHNGEIRFNYIHRLGALKEAILKLIYKNKSSGKQGKNI